MYFLNEKLVFASFVHCIRMGWVGIEPSPRTIFRYFSFSRFSMYSFIKGMQHKPTTNVRIATATMLLATIFEWAASEQDAPVHGDSQKQ